MVTRPQSFNDLIKNHEDKTDIYKALEKDDLSEVVVTALKIMRRRKVIPPLKHRVKCERHSEAIRKQGNDSLKPERLQEAVEYYNEALLYAPSNSRAMKLAYGNRSYVYLKKNQYTACLRDVEMSLAITTTTDTDEKLKVRLKDASAAKDIESLIRYQGYTIYGPTFFNLQGKRNPEIPCVSTDVGVVIERQGPLIVAKTDVKVGSVLAKEDAFVVETGKFNCLNSCYYCLKKSLNLIPCDGCCYALFCDTKCRQASLNEGHNIECQIMEIVDEMTTGPLSKLVVKSVLKIRQKCASWKEFINASHIYGYGRVKISTINEIFDVHQKFSMLCFNDDRLFVHGKMYNCCVASAVIIDHLGRIKNYFPEAEDEKREVESAVGRVMMYLLLNGVQTNISQVITMISPNITSFSPLTMYGWYSFIGKLKHSCNPNLMPISLNRKMVLITVRPIKAGSPLTVNYLGANVDSFTSTMNTTSLFSLYGISCNCVTCTGKRKLKKKNTLDDELMTKLQKLNFADIILNFSSKEAPKMFPILCEIMTVLKDVPLSEEYDTAQSYLSKCLVGFADFECCNFLLDQHEYNTK